MYVLWLLCSLYKYYVKTIPVSSFIDTFFCKIYITILLVQVLINQSIWGSRVTKKNTKPCSLVYTTPQSPDTFMNNACYD